VLTASCALRHFLLVAAGHSIVEHGLPPLGHRQGSNSAPSINPEHQPASLKEQSFRAIPELKLHICPSSIWVRYHNKAIHTWTTETSVQMLVTNVLEDAVMAAGLETRLSICNELSIMKVCPDIWVVMTASGKPVGVCEVKTPGSTIMNSRMLHGQIYDYMLRLRSFHGLKRVFGIVSTYRQWRLYWLNDSDAVSGGSVLADPAAASSSPSPLPLSVSQPAVLPVATDIDVESSELDADPLDDEDSKEDLEDVCEVTLVATRCVFVLVASLTYGELITIARAFR